MQSNVLPAVMAEVIIEPAFPDWWKPALELLYQPHPPLERALAVAKFEELLSAGLVSADLLLIARTHKAVRGVVLAVPHLSQTAFVFPPVVDAGHDSPLGVQLLQALTQRLEAAGFTLGQCVRDVGDRRSGRWLVAGGFQEQGRMLVLERELAENLEDIPPDELDLQALPYAPENPETFKDVLERTLVGTLDCPELTGFRTAGDIIECHATAGDVGTQLWQTYMLEGEPAGVLMLAEHGAEQVLEVLYVGIVPEHRGQGLGRRLMNDALRLSKRRGALRLRLHVSGANHYAIDVYRAVGMRETASAMLHLWSCGRPCESGQ